VVPSEARREALKQVYEEARGCVRCPQLAAARHQVVFGAGNASADLLFVAEAPGVNEDREGLPLVGQAGKLLDQLLADVGLARRDVFVTTVVKCRPPGNREPHPAEIEHCHDYLARQLDLIAPKVVCSLGNFATKLVRGDPAGITRVHGREEVRVIGRRAVRLYPIYHPAAALYTPRMLEVLREDFARLPQLLAQPAPAQVPVVVEPPPAPEPVGEPPAPPIQAAPAPELEPEEPIHLDTEAELVAEFAETGAEHGAGPEIHVNEPWDGYAKMSAAGIRDRVLVAGAEEVAVVQLYEAMHRKRRTVLDAVERRSKELASAPSAR
jgi:DNA polymerase